MKIKKILASVIAVLLAFSVVLPAVADTETPSSITDGAATPTDAATPAEATPTDTATPADATPADAATPAEATATDAATPADAATPTEVSSQTDPEDPATSTTPDTPADPATSTTPDTPANPATSTTPDTPANPATSTNPVNPNNPVNPSNPDNPVNPSEGDYDFEEDERLRSTTAADYNAGNFGWGSYAPAMYGIMDKKVYTIDGIPTKVNEITEKEEPAIVDSTSIETPENEGITLCAFYTFKCPACGNAVGDTSLYSIYKSGQGNCTHCGAKLPNPDTVKIYRMIIVDPSSPHKKTMKGYDFTKVAKEVYGATAELYGDGKDLPEQYMIFSERQIEGTEDTYTVYSDFYTKGIHGDFKEGFMARLMLFIVRFIVWLTPRAQKFDESGYNDLVWKIRVKLFESLESILVRLASGRE